MKTCCVDLTIEDSVGVVVINNPPHNSLTLSLLEDFLQIAHYLPTTNAKAVVITGSPRCFCSGVATDELKKIRLRTEAETLLAKGQEIVSHIENFPVPVLAAITGACLGGGMELALACHVRYSSDTAVFGFPELSLGIIPAFGGTWLLPKSVGYGKSVELMLRCSLLNAREAKDLGLIEGILPRKDLLGEVIRIAKSIARQNPHAVQLVLESLLSTRRKGPYSHPNNDELLERLLESRMNRVFISA